MTFIPWTKNECIDNKMIDAQHKKMTEIVNQIHSVLGTNDKKQIKKLCSELETTVKEHFETEEELMKEYKFESYISHKLEHDRYYKKILKLSYDSAEDHNLVNMAFLLSFKNWFYNHLDLNDRKLGVFLKSKGIK